MKKNTFLLLVTVTIILATSCKREQYTAPDITGVGTDTVVLNIGDVKVLAPNITNLKGNNYSWLVNGKETASGVLNYTFEATAAGNFNVTFKAGNKAGTSEQTFKILVEKPIAITIAEPPAVSMCNVVEIAPAVTGPNRIDYEYEWSIGDSVIGKKRELSFISTDAGTYEITLRATAGKQSATATRAITVKAETYVKNAFTVLAYLPAPAKNHNWSIIGYAESWKYGQEFPLPYAEFLTKASALRKENVANGLFLGSWGGSATFKFDHTVANAPGKPDVEITAIYSKLDVPAVYVAYDRNKNGQPDENEWYTIKNEDYGIEDLPEHEITFTYKKTDTDDRRIYSYFDWKDNQLTPTQGEVTVNKTFSSSTTTSGAFSTRGFFPGYNMVDVPSKKVALLEGWSDSFKRKGKRISRNLSGAPQFYQKFNVDIDLAVNAKGEPVQLPGIDFIKVQKIVYPFQQEAGAGSTLKDFNMEEGRLLQVFGILDRHIK